jgi:predicted kinase
MKKDNKQRLFEVMGKLDKTFNSNSIGDFNNIDWKMLHKQLMLNTEIIKEGGKSIRKNLTATINDLTNEDGILTPEELQRLKDFGLIDISGFANLNSLFPIISNKKYFDLNTFKIKAAEIWNEESLHEYKQNNIIEKNGKQRLFEVMERLNPDFKEKDKPKFIIPVGIAGGGKSTWIKSQTDSNTIVVSPDEIRKELTGSISNQSKNSEVWSTAFDKVVNALNAGKNVILDATNIKSSDRKRLMNHLKVNVDKPFDAFAKIFDVDPEVAKQRIKKDVESGVDRSNVPDFVIDRQYQSYINDINLLEPEGFKIID